MFRRTRTDGSGPEVVSVGYEPDLEFVDPARRRVALVTEGTYPFHGGGVSVWCDQLIRGLPSTDFLVVGVCLSHRDRPVWEIPENASVLAMPFWDRVLEADERPGRPMPLPAIRRLVELITMPPMEHGDETAIFGATIDELVVAAEAGQLAKALHFEPMCEVFTEGLAASEWLRLTHHGTLLDVARLAEAFSHILRPLLFDLGPLDLVHLSATGLPSLVALSMNRRRGTPIVLTEHGLYLRERYLDLSRGGLRPAETAVLLRFYHLLVAATYRRAAVIAPVSDYNRRWQERIGAAPTKVQVIYSAVESSAFPLQLKEPEQPTVTWLGRIDPIKDLHTLIRAAAVMRDREPEVSVRLFGGAAPAQRGYLASCHDLVDELTLQDVVSFEGPVDTAPDAFHRGHISALSSVSEGFPYAVLESMACGVPVVGTDVGGVREAIADVGRCVPAKDHEALGTACLELLGDRDLRRGMARRGRKRVQDNFDLDGMLGAYERVYTEVSGLRGRRLTVVESPIDLRSDSGDDRAASLP